MSTNLPRGLSAIELIVVLAILGILFAIGPLVLPRDRFVVNQAVERFERDIQRARFNAISHNTALWFAVDPATGAYTATPLSTDPGAQRAGFVVNLADVGLSGVVIAAIDDDDNGPCEGDPGAGVWQFDSRGVGRQSGVTSVEFGHRSGSHTVVLCVNSYGEVERQ